MRIASLSQSTGKKMFLLLFFAVGIFSMILIQYTFKFKSFLYPCIVTTIVFFCAGSISRKLDVFNSIFSYLLFSTTFVLIQLYGLKINFQGLKYISPLLIAFSILFFFLGHYFSTKNIRKYYLLLLPLLIMAGYYFMSKLSHQEKVKTIYLKVTDNWIIRDSNGRLFDMKRLDNKVALVNFWDSRCAYCFKKLPYIERIKSRIDTTQVIFLEINPAILDNFDDFRKAVSNNSILKNSNSYFEENNKLSHQLSISTLPNQFLVDRKGIIRYSYLGFSPDEELFFEDSFVNIINELIDER